MKHLIKIDMQNVAETELAEGVIELLDLQNNYTIQKCIGGEMVETKDSDELMRAYMNETDIFYIEINHLKAFEHSINYLNYKVIEADKKSAVKKLVKYK